MISALELASLEREIYASHEQQRLMELELNVRRAGATNGVDTTNTSASTARRQLEALNVELARKRSVYSDSHPDILALRRQIASLEEQESAIAASSPGQTGPSATSLALDIPSRLLDEKIESLKVRRANLQSKRDDVSRAIETLNRLIVTVPEVQAHLGNLERRHENMRTRLDELNAKLDEARLGERLELDKQAERFEVIEQPITPTDPTRPNRPLILMGGLGLAAGAALGIALLLEMLNRTVRSTADVARILGQPPLAAIPYITTAGELRRRRMRAILVLLVTVTMVSAALLVLHWAYMPLDEFGFRLLGRFGI